MSVRRAMRRRTRLGARVRPGGSGPAKGRRENPAKQGRSGCCANGGRAGRRQSMRGRQARFRPTQAMILTAAGHDAKRPDQTRQQQHRDPLREPASFPATGARARGGCGGIGRISHSLARSLTCSSSTRRVSCCSCFVSSACCVYSQEYASTCPPSAARDRQPRNGFLVRFPVVRGVRAGGSCSRLARAWQRTHLHRWSASLVQAAREVVQQSGCTVGRQHRRRREPSKGVCERRTCTWCSVRETLL